MKKRLHDKKAGIAILISLIIISLAELIFRAVAMGLEAVLTTSNFGEQLVTIILSAFIIIMTLKGKDRICYICYGAWLGCFVFDQMFGLPSMITNMVVNISNPGILSIVIRVIVMICIIAIGALLVEYMHDGSIHNRAFNILCIVTVLLLAVNICGGIYCFAFVTPDVTPNGISATLLKNQIMLDVFNKAYHIVMVFLFTFFAYDSAKAQLKKTDLTK